VPPSSVPRFVRQIDDEGDPLFLQFKEAEASVLEPFLGESDFANYEQRVASHETRGVQTMSSTVKHVEGVLAERIEQDVLEPMADFQDPSQEWRRLFSELYGTFLLVIVAAGGGMIGHAFPDTISRTAAVVAPGMMVMGIIMFMGKISGAHLNPAVSVAFSLRGDFPWRRVPGYVLVQLIGAALAALLLREVVEVSAKYGSNYPASGYSSWQAFLMEALLTLGLVSVILGTASGAQNIGIFGAIGVGAYVALAGLWGSPISGASMNPARTFGPDLVGRDFTNYWLYVVGPLLGAALAVGFAYVLRGPGGGASGSAAAQGALDTEAQKPGQA
jgi:aquaporin Z